MRYPSWRERLDRHYYLVMLLLKFRGDGMPRAQWAESLALNDADLDQMLRGLLPATHFVLVIGQLSHIPAPHYSRGAVLQFWWSCAWRRLQHACGREIPLPL